MVDDNELDPTEAEAEDEVGTADATDTGGEEADAAPAAPAAARPLPDPLAAPAGASASDDEEEADPNLVQVADRGGSGLRAPPRMRMPSPDKVPTPTEPAAVPQFPKSLQEEIIANNPGRFDGMLDAEGRVADTGMFNRLMMAERFRRMGPEARRRYIQGDPAHRKEVIRDLVNGEAREQTRHLIGQKGYNDHFKAKVDELRTDALGLDDLDEFSDARERAARKKQKEEDAKKPGVLMKGATVAGDTAVAAAQGVARGAIGLGDTIGHFFSEFARRSVQANAAIQAGDSFIAGTMTSEQAQEWTEAARVSSDAMFGQFQDWSAQMFRSLREKTDAFADERLSLATQGARNELEHAAKTGKLGDMAGAMWNSPRLWFTEGGHLLGMIAGSGGVTGAARYGILKLAGTELMSASKAIALGAAVGFTGEAVDTTTSMWHEIPADDRRKTAIWNETALRYKAETGRQATDEEIERIILRTLRREDFPRQAAIQGIFVWMGHAPAQAAARGLGLQVGRAASTSLFDPLKVGASMAGANAASTASSVATVGSAKSGESMTVELQRAAKDPAVWAAIWQGLIFGTPLGVPGAVQARRGRQAPGRGSPEGPDPARGPDRGSPEGPDPARGPDRGSPDGLDDSYVRMAERGQELPDNSYRDMAYASDAESRAAPRDADPLMPGIDPSYVDMAEGRGRVPSQVVREPVHGSRPDELRALPTPDGSPPFAEPFRGPRAPFTGVIELNRFRDEPSYGNPNAEMLARLREDDRVLGTLSGPYAELAAAIEASARASEEMVAIDKETAKATAGLHEEIRKEAKLKGPRDPNVEEAASTILKEVENSAVVHRAEVEQPLTQREQVRDAQADPRVRYTAETSEPMSAAAREATVAWQRDNLIEALRAAGHSPAALAHLEQYVRYNERAKAWQRKRSFAARWEAARTREQPTPEDRAIMRAADVFEATHRDGPAVDVKPRRLSEAERADLARGTIDLAQLKVLASDAQPYYARTGLSVRAYRTPAEARAALATETIPDGVKAVTIVDDAGKPHVLLFAEGIRDGLDAQRTLDHEVVGHFLLEHMLGDRGMANIQNAVASGIARGDRNLARIRDLVEETYPAREFGHQERLNEIIARVAEESTPLTKGTRGVLDAVREGLQSLGIRWGLTRPLADRTTLGYEDLRRLLREVSASYARGETAEINQFNVKGYARKAQTADRVDQHIIRPNTYMNLARHIGDRNQYVYQMLRLMGVTDGSTELQLRRMTSDKADLMSGVVLQNIVRPMEKAIGKLAKDWNSSYDVVRAQLDQYLNAVSTAETNERFRLERAPLKTKELEQLRADTLNAHRQGHISRDEALRRLNEVVTDETVRSDSWKRDAVSAAGMTNAEAAALLASMGDRVHAFERINREHVDVLRGRVLEWNLKAGYWDKAQIELAGYKNYVPRKGRVEGVHEPLARDWEGLSNNMTETQKAARGRRSVAQHGLTQLVNEALHAANRKVNNDFMNNVRKHIEADRANVVRAAIEGGATPEAAQRLASKWGAAAELERIEHTVTGSAEEPNPRTKYPKKPKSYEISEFFVHDEATGKGYVLSLHDDNVAKAFARSRLIDPNADVGLAKIAATTRQMGRLFTSYSPRFWYSSLARDIPSALLQVATERSRDATKPVRPLATSWDAVRTAAGAMRTITSNGDGRRMFTASIGAREALREQWRAGNHADLEARYASDPEGLRAAIDARKDLLDYVDRGGLMSFGMQFEASSVLSADPLAKRSKIVEAAKKAEHAMDAVVQFMDNTRRFGVYKALVEHGVPKDRAVTVARSMQDLNQRGAFNDSAAFGWRWARAAMAFLNPNMVGVHAMVERRLWRSGEMPIIWDQLPDGTYKMRLAPDWVKQLNRPLAGILLASGAAQVAIAAQFWGSDPTTGEDAAKKISVERWMAQGGVLFRAPGMGDSPVVVPGQYGINRILTSIGTGAALIAYGYADAEEVAHTLANVLYENAVAIGQPKIPGPGKLGDVGEWGATIANAISPMILQPLTQIATNRNAFGTRIHRDPNPNRPQLASQDGLPATPQEWHDLAQWVYRTTGVDAHPETYMNTVRDLGPAAMIADYLELTSGKIKDRGIMSMLGIPKQDFSSEGYETRELMEFRRKNLAPMYQQLQAAKKADLPQNTRLDPKFVGDNERDFHEAFPDFKVWARADRAYQRRLSEMSKAIEVARRAGDTDEVHALRQTQKEFTWRFLDALRENDTAALNAFGRGPAGSGGGGGGGGSRAASSPPSGMMRLVGDPLIEIPQAPTDDSAEPVRAPSLRPATYDAQALRGGSMPQVGVSENVLEAPPPHPVQRAYTRDQQRRTARGVAEYEKSRTPDMWPLQDATMSPLSAEAEGALGSLSAYYKDVLDGNVELGEPNGGSEALQAFATIRTRGRLGKKVRETKHRAEALERDGADPLEVFHTTGLYRRWTNDWAAPIPFNDLKFDPTLSTAKLPPLADVLSWPSFFEEYPGAQLARVTASRKPNTGFYRPGDPESGRAHTLAWFRPPTQADSPGSPRYTPRSEQSVAVHEVTHLAQRLVGDEAGGNVTDILRSRPRLSRAEAWTLYQSLGSETEARAHQARFEAERRGVTDTLPSWFEDMPRSHQLTIEQATAGNAPQSYRGRSDAVHGPQLASTREAAERYQSMVTRGANPLEATAETGVSRGRDGLLKVEIPAGELVPRGAQDFVGVPLVEGAPISSIVQAPELFRVDPTLAAIPVISPPGGPFRITSASSETMKQQAWHYRPEAANRGESGEAIWFDREAAARIGPAATRRSLLRALQAAALVRSGSKAPIASVSGRPSPERLQAHKQSLRIGMDVLRQEGSPARALTRILNDPQLGPNHKRRIYNYISNGGTPENMAARLSHVREVLRSANAIAKEHGIPIQDAMDRLMTKRAEIGYRDYSEVMLRNAVERDRGVRPGLRRDPLTSTEDVAPGDMFFR